LARLLNCNCGAPLTISDAAAGQQVPCTECGKEVNVPGLRDLRLLPVVEAKSETKNETAPTSAGPSMANICFLGGLLIVGLGGIMALTFNPVFAGFAVIGLIMCVGGLIGGKKA
jgi:hypothetical protein